MTTIHVNPVSPQKLVMTCTPSAACPDMSVVRSTVLKLKKPTGGVVMDLATTVVSQSSASLTVAHLFAAGDVDKAGLYKVYPLHTLDIGSVRGDVQQFQALDPFDTGGST